MIWLSTALAAPLQLELGEPGSHPADRSRYGLVVPTSAGPTLLASPLVHEKPGHRCDGDEWAFGDPEGGVHPPRWCPSGGDEDEDPALVPVRGEVLLEAPSDLEALEPIRTVWNHTFWTHGTGSRPPCGELKWADNADGVLHGVSRDARVHAGVLDFGEELCPVKVGPSGFGWDCELPEGVTGELRLFDFARQASCEDPSVPAVVLTVTTPGGATVAEAPEPPAAPPREAVPPWGLAGLGLVGGLVIGLAVARVRERTRVEAPAPVHQDLRPELDRARASVRSLGGRVAALEKENAELRANLASRPEPPPVRKPSGLQASLEQVLAYPELLEACGAVCDLGHKAHGDLFRQGKALLEHSKRLRTLSDGEHAEAWAALEASFEEGYKELSAFALGARHLRSGSAEAVLELVRAEKAYQSRGGRVPRGVRAWARLLPAVERKQADGGAALANGLRREVFNGFVVPWLRLAQLLVEALPHELPDAPRVELEVEAHATAALARLGYGYEHVPLYAVQEREFLNRKVMVTRAEGLSVRPDTAGLVVRVQVPIVPTSPRGHTVRAVLQYLEAP